MHICRQRCYELHATYGWYYISVNNRAPAWTGVDELYRFLTTNRGAGPRAILTDLSQIQNGDIIQLQFTDKERFDHSPVVVDAGNRTPQSILVAAHSYDADCRPLSSYRYIKDTSVTYYECRRVKILILMHIFH